MRIPVGIAIVLVLCACGGDSGTSTPPKSTNQTWDVTASGLTFFPTIQPIAVGDTVRWTFYVNTTDNLGHNVLFRPVTAGAPDDVPTDGKEIRSGSDFRVFKTAGEFNYVCSLHGSMTGQISVH